MSAVLGGAHTTYTTPNKCNHRIIIAQHARNVPGSIVYTDARDGACTLALIEQGISKERLFPINYSDAHCRSIQEKTGIMAVCVDVLDFVGMCHGVSVFWLDMEQWFIPQETLQECRNRLVTDGMLALTLTYSRYQGGASKHNAVAQVKLKNAGFRVVGVEQYTGASGVMNMHFVRALCGNVPARSAVVQEEVVNDEDGVSVVDGDSSRGDDAAFNDEEQLTELTDTSPYHHMSPEPAVLSSYKKTVGCAGTIVFLHSIQKTVMLGNVDEYVANAHERRFTMTLANGCMLPPDSLNFDDKAGRRGARCRDATDYECDAFKKEYESVTTSDALLLNCHQKRKRAMPVSSNTDAPITVAQKPKKPRLVAQTPPTENFPIYFVQNAPQNPMDAQASDAVVWALSRDWYGGMAVAEVEPSTGRVLKDLDTSYVKKADRNLYLGRWRDAKFWFSGVSENGHSPFRRYYIEFDTLPFAPMPFPLFSQCIPNFIVESVAYAPAMTKYFVTGRFQDATLSKNGLCDLDGFEYKFASGSINTLSDLVPCEHVKRFLEDNCRKVTIQMSGCGHAISTEVRPGTPLNWLVPGRTTTTSITNLK